MQKEKMGVGDRVQIGVLKGVRSKCKLIGRWKTEVFDKDGNLRESDHGENQVTLIGDAHVADQLSDQGDNPMSHMAVGTTSGGKTEASTTLEAEDTRNALTSGPTQGAGAADDEIEYVGTFTGIADTLVEWAIFNAAGAGVMLVYAEGSHVVTAPDTLVITWTVTVSH